MPRASLRLLNLSSSIFPFLKSSILLANSMTSFSTMGFSNSVLKLCMMMFFSLPDASIDETGVFWIKNYILLTAFSLDRTFECSPHSLWDASHHHLPALGSSPGDIALVQGAQPILTNPLS